MDLKVSYNWLREYVDTKLSPADLARELSLHGPSIERIHPQELNFEKVIVGEILAISPHPDADKLRLATVDIGKDQLSIVCGAPNIEVGQKVPVVLIGGQVGEMEIKATVIRGVQSHGMLCSARELGLSDDHSGIYVLPTDTKVGTPLEKLLKTKDTLVDVEVTGNRTDLMSIVGLAREAAAITGGKYLYQELKSPKKPRQMMPLTATVSDKKACRRYQAAVIEGVTVGPSPLWLQQRLLLAGLRPINNIVDVTNYILLEYGQPLHAFDYEKISKHKIIVRRAEKGEHLRALDGKEYELDESMLVIADSDKPLAIAGIMGGEASATTADTITVVIEAANFDPLSIRKTARGLNLFSDSSALFEKDLHPQSTSAALLRAIELISEVAGGQLASEIIDIQPTAYKQKKISLSPERVSELMGERIAAKDVAAILKRLGFAVSGSKMLTVTVPWWRDHDIEIERDLIEEVARIYGYHNIVPQLPPARAAMPLPWPQFAQEQSLKQALSGPGFIETYSYSLVSEKMIAAAGLKAADHLPVSNPLSQDYAYLRTSLVPSLLEVIDNNQARDKQLHLFEMSNVYLPRKNDLPLEQLRLALALTGSDTVELFRELKGKLEVMLSEAGIAGASYAPADASSPYMQAASTGTIVISGHSVGTIGLINPRIAKNFGVKQPTAIAEIDVAALLAHARSTPRYEPIAKYPAVELDLSFEIDQNIEYDAIVGFAKNIDPLIERVEFLSVYAGEKVAAGKKALALRLSYREGERTLTLDEAQAAHQKIARALEKEYTAHIR